MVLHKISKRIAIPPSYLSHNLFHCVKEILEKERKNLNSQKNGYVVRIEEIQKIDNIVSRDTKEIFLDVIFVVESFFIKPGLKLIATVKMILPTGILAVCHDIKIWIPESEMNGYKFQSSVYIKNEDIIQLFQDIQIQVTVIRYERKSFSCIGKLTT